MSRVLPQNPCWVWALLFSFLVQVGVCDAETVYFKNGRKVDAKIIERNEKNIVVDFYGTRLTYWLDEVERIEANGSPSQDANATSSQPSGSSLQADNKHQNEGDSMLYTLKATEALQRNEVEVGTTLLEKALKLNPNNHVALGALAGVYANFKHDLQKSTELFRKSLEIKSDYDMSHFGLGLNYATMGMKQEAKKEFEATLRVTDKPHMKDSAKKALLMLEQQP